jgi:hypothetical protein
LRPKPNILVVNGYLDYPMRQSVRDLIYSFHNNKNCNAFIYSIEQGPLPGYLKKVKFDLVVFTTLLLGERWGGQEKMYEKVYEPIKYLQDLDVVKIVHPQDEWIHTNELNNFINDFNVSHVFSVAPESEWKKIYNKVDSSKVKFHRVLTGYLEERTVRDIKRITDAVTAHKTDIGYRAYKSPPWLGSHGYLKTKIAEVFSKEAPENGLTIDISTKEKDTIYGDDWFRFMATCRFFIGAEGGSTVIDPDGSIFKKGIEYERSNPNASFNDFEKNCFPEMDGNLGLIAISPRHLEACAAKTCQVLVEGDYNGVLKPGLHYIEVKKDFSNLKEVFQKMKDDKLRKNIIEVAYTDIVASGKYSYTGYTDLILKATVSEYTGSDIITTKRSLIHNRISDARFWRRKQKVNHRVQQTA